MRGGAATLAALAVLPALAALPAAADIAALPEASRAALAERARGLSAALVDRDHDAMFGFLPPRLVARIAAEAGHSPATFRALYIENALMTREQTGVTRHWLNLQAATLFTGTDGATYALIPTESTAFDPHRGRFRLKATTVGIPAGDTWYFVTLDGPAAQARLTATYPALAAATLAPATLTPAP